MLEGMAPPDASSGTAVVGAAPAVVAGRGSAPPSAAGVVPDSPEAAVVPGGGIDAGGVGPRFVFPCRTASSASLFFFAGSSPIDQEEAGEQQAKPIFLERTCLYAPMWRGAVCLSHFCRQQKLSTTMMRHALAFLLGYHGLPTRTINYDTKNGAVLDRQRNSLT